MGAMLAKMTIEDIIDPAVGRMDDDDRLDCCCWGQRKQKSRALVLVLDQGSSHRSRQPQPGSSSSSTCSKFPDQPASNNNKQGCDPPSISSRSNSNTISSHNSSYYQKHNNNNNNAAAPHLYHSTSSVTSRSTLSTVSTQQQQQQQQQHLQQQSTFHSNSFCTMTKTTKETYGTFGTKNSFSVSSSLSRSQAFRSADNRQLAAHDTYHSRVVIGRSRHSAVVLADIHGNVGLKLPKQAVAAGDDSLPPPNVDELSAKKVIEPRRDEILMLSASLARNGTFVPVTMCGGANSTCPLPNQQHLHNATYTTTTGPSQEQLQQQHQHAEDAFQAMRYESRTWGMYQRITDDRIRQFPPMLRAGMHSDGDIMYPLEEHPSYSHHDHHQHWDVGGFRQGASEQEMVFSCDLD